MQPAVKGGTMKKILFSVLALFLFIPGASAKFVENRNEKARLYNGFYFDDVHLVMKWSKDWTPMATEPEGAWVTNHYVWYSDDYEEVTYYGYDTLTSFETGMYKIEEFIKMKALDQSEVDAALAEGITVIWGNIAIIKDIVVVYDANTGEKLDEFDLTTGNPNPGLGKNRIF